MLEELQRRLPNVQVDIVAEVGKRDLVIAGSVKTNIVFRKSLPFKTVPHWSPRMAYSAVRSIAPNHDCSSDHG